LSAVSQQVQTIQQALKDQQDQSHIVIELVGKSVTVQPQTGTDRRHGVLCEATALAGLTSWTMC